MSEDLLNHIPKLGEVLNRRKRKGWFRKIKYDVLAGAVYWTDEFPLGMESDLINCLRFVLRYRTSLILEEPEEKWKELWNEAKSSFPEWVGFRVERCSPDPKIVQFYNKHDAELKSNLLESTDLTKEELDEIWNMDDDEFESRL